MLPIHLLLFGLAVKPEQAGAGEPVRVIAEIPVAAVPELMAIEPQGVQEKTQEPKNTDGADEAEQKKPVTPPHTGVRALLDGLKEDVQHLPSTANLYLAALGGGLALAVHPIDQ